MKKDTNAVRAFYRKSGDSYDRYMMANEKRVGEIRRVYSSNKKYFGKSVLDIACGGGILGFVVEPKGHAYVGIDINPDMIAGAREYAKRIKSRNKFVLGNVKTAKIPGKFDTVTLIGNALGHFVTGDFLEILAALNKFSAKGAYFITDYRDVVEMLFKKQWKDRMTERNGLISITTGCDTEVGTIYKKMLNKNGSPRLNFDHTIWSPFVIEPMMILAGWKLVNRKRLGTWAGWTDVYRKGK